MGSFSMPLIDDFANKKTKKFTKKEYRPWDYEELSQDINNTTDVMLPIIANTQEELIIPANEWGYREIINQEEAKDTATALILRSSSFSDESLTMKNEELSKLDLEKYARGIYGLQRLILQNLLQRIDKKDSSFFYTQPILFKELSSLIKAPITSLKGTIYRLRELKILEVYEYKPGRGGYTSYKIPILVGNFFTDFFEKKSSNAIIS